MSLTERDKAVVWHPYTHLKTSPPPIAITRASGVYIYDEEGNEILDAISSWWVNIHGHANPHIAKRIAEQAHELEHVIFSGFTHGPAVELAEGVLNILPSSQQKAFYSDNGSTAVEVALKMALQYWSNQGIEKKRIIAFDHAYHGDTFGTMSVSGRSPFNKSFETFLFDVDYVPPPIPENEAACFEKMELALKSGEVAAIIFEPLILGSGGMLMYSPEVLDSVIQLCKKYNVLIIDDEVMTGFGRTGKLFAADYLQEQPDIMCFSKGITGGFLPMGFTTCTMEIFDQFVSDDKMKTLYHGHSYTGNPIACAAGLASLEITISDETTENLDRINAKHQAFLKEIESMTVVTNPRLMGTIVAFDLDTGEENSYLHSIRDQIYNFFLAENILLRPLGNTIYIMPPYIITDQQLDQVYTAIKKFLATF